MQKSLYFFVFVVFLRPIWAASIPAPDPLQQAQTYFEKKSYKKVVSLCDKVLDKNPRAAEAYYWKGRALEAQEKPLEAANEYQAALLAQDNFPEAREGLARVGTLLGKDSSQ